jgi:serine/threonine protein kinase
MNACSDAGSPGLSAPTGETDAGVVVMLCPDCGAAYRRVATSDASCLRDGARLELASDLDPRVGTRVGNYRLVELLGSGGMGSVYRAEHVMIGKQVAIKLLHPQAASEPELVQRFLREACASARIGHPNIVEVLDFGELADRATYLVMEYVPGQQLADLLAHRGPFPLLRAINIVGQLSGALAAAHARQIVHRDVKPPNIIIDQRPGRREVLTAHLGPPFGVSAEREEVYDFVKLCDFGIAKIQEAEGGRLTQLGTAVGTPEYIAPETLLGMPADPLADVYGLGIVFYELLTGQVPFQGASPAETAGLVLGGDPTPLATAHPSVDVTSEAEDLIRRMISRDPAQRPPSMNAVREELSTCYGRAVYRSKLAGMPGVAPDRTLAQEVNQLLAERPTLILDSAPPPKAASPQPSITGRRRWSFGRWVRRLRELSGL